VAKMLPPVYRHLLASDRLHFQRPHPLPTETGQSTAPLMSTAATPTTALLDPNLPRRHRRLEVIKNPSPSKERERGQTSNRVRPAVGGSHQVKGDENREKIHPVRVLRFE